MDKKLVFREIDAESWLKNAKLIPTLASTPWLRVANNIFHSLQWIGKDAVTKPERRYFAIINGEHIICSFGIYFLSDHVVRTRGFYCDPQWRGRGLMKACLENGLQLVYPRATKALAFASKQAIDFHLRCGFHFIDNVEPRPVIYYDYHEKKYTKAPDETITVMQKFIRPNAQLLAIK